MIRRRKNFIKFLWVFIVLFFSFWFSQDLGNKIINSTTEDVFYLHEGVNEIKAPYVEEKKWIFKIWWEDAINDNNYKTLWLKGNVNFASYNGSKLIIRCQDGKITDVWSTFTNNCSALIQKPDWYTSEICYTWGLQIDKVVLTILSGWFWFSNIKWYVYLKCLPTDKPEKVVETIANLNYQTVLSKADNPFWDVFSISLQKQDKSIPISEIIQKMAPKKQIRNQPTFAQILYLQLKTIWNLTESLKLSKENFSFSGLFFPWDYEKYQAWLEKFSKFWSLEEMVNALSWAITLKDIWVAQDVVRGLLKCANDNNCNWVINFQCDDINSKFCFYKMENMEKQILKNNWLIDEFVKYYNDLKDKCSSNWEADNFVKTQIDWVCQLLLKDSISDIDDQSLADLWYALWIRVKNLQNIKNWVSNSWLNLLWVYNVYWEVNNLTLGTYKINVVKKVKNVKNEKKKIKVLKKIVVKDLKELKDFKISDETNLFKKKAIYKTMMEILDVNDPLYDEAKNKDFNIFNFKNYEVSENWIVNIVWLEQDDESEDDSDDIELDDDNNISYTWQVLYDWWKVIGIKICKNWKCKLFKKLWFKEFYPIKYTYLDYDYRVFWFYLMDWINLQSLDNINNSCIEEGKECWSTLGGWQICWYDNIKIRRCFWSKINSQNRSYLKVKYDWWNGVYIVKIFNF